MLEGTWREWVKFGSVSYMGIVNASSIHSMLVAGKNY
jgi:hypothetical protein